jgi:hypothetical protein
MRRELRPTRLAALAAVALVLAAAAACNDVDDPGTAESVVLVTGVSTAGLSVASAVDTTATLTYTLNPRHPEATSFYHDINLTSYTVSFSPAVVASMGGAISTGFCPAGTSCAVTLALVPNGLKPGAGTTVIATVQVEGRDVNDNPVNFDATIPLTFLP